MQKLSKVFSPDLYKFIVSFLLIFIPLFPKFPAIRIPGIYVSVRLEDFLILASIIVFSTLLIPNFKKVFKNKVSRAIALFLFIGLISTLSAIFITKTVSGSIAFLHYFRRIEYLSLFFVGYLFIKYSNVKNFWTYLLKVLIIVNFFIFIYALGQRYLDLPVIITQNEEYSKGVALRWVPGAHINSTFAGHYDLASYLVLTSPLFVLSFLMIKDKLTKGLLALSIISSFLLFSLAVSRISILSFGVAVALSLIIYKKYKELLIIGLISILAFGFSADLRIRFNRIYQVFIEKVSSVIVVSAQEEVVFEDRSTSIRLNVEWPRAIRAFTKNPLLGTGYSSITLATDNDYLRLLGEIGILGFGSFILIIINVIKYLINYTVSNKISSVFVVSMLCSTVGILITALFIDVFEASKFATIYWLFIGFTVAYTDKKILNT